MIYKTTLTNGRADRILHFEAEDAIKAGQKVRALALAMGQLGLPIGVIEGPHRNFDPSPWLQYQGWADARHGTPNPELVSYPIYRDSYRSNRIEIAGGLTVEEAALLLPF